MNPRNDATQARQQMLTALTAIPPAQAFVLQQRPDATIPVTQRYSSALIQGLMHHINELTKQNHAITQASSAREFQHNVLHAAQNQTIAGLQEKFNEVLNAYDNVLHNAVYEIDVRDKKITNLEQRLSLFGPQSTQPALPQPLPQLQSPERLRRS